MPLSHPDRSRRRLVASLTGSVATALALLLVGGAVQPVHARVPDRAAVAAPTSATTSTAVSPTPADTIIAGAIASTTTSTSTTSTTSAPPTPAADLVPATVAPSVAAVRLGIAATESIEAAPDTTLPPETTLPPTTTVPPPPPPPPPSNGDPGLVGLDRARVALRLSLPAAWQGHIEPPLQEVEGYTSLAWYDSSYNSLRTDISTGHLTGGWDHLRFVVVHEWAHHVAFAYGTRAFPGAPPEGFPFGNAANVAERWADCAAVAITGHEYIAPGHDACQPEQRAFAADWFAANAPG